MDTLNRLLLIGAAGGLIVTNTSFAANFSARNAAMGGAGVASSTYDAAAGSNAALLTRFDESDDLAIVLPAVGVEGSDEYEVIDTLDDVVDSYDTLELAINNNDPITAIASRDAILSDLATIDKQPVRADAAALLAVALPSKSLAFAVEARGRVDLFAFADYVPTDEAIINDAIISGDSTLLDDIDSSALAFGVVISEVALSFAREFTVGGMPLAVGVTPKHQTVETILYRATVKDFDEDDIDADEYTEEDSNVNLDIGLALGLGESLTLGLQLRDLIEEEYATATGAGGYSSQYTLEPQATAGIAWRGGIFTVAFDLDITEQQPFEEIDGSQFARLGAEIDLFNWLQLRAGIRQDLKDTREDLLTAGIGISPFDTFHLDLTAAAGDNDTYGGAIDLRLTF